MRLTLSILMLLVLLAPAPATADSPQPPAQHQITVMSRNVYHGVDEEINIAAILEDKQPAR